MTSDWWVTLGGIGLGSVLGFVATWATKRIDFQREDLKRHRDDDSDRIKELITGYEALDKRREDDRGRVEEQLRQMRQKHGELWDMLEKCERTNREQAVAHYAAIDQLRMEYGKKITDLVAVNVQLAEKISRLEKMTS